MARFLVVCDGGNVRSHALAYVLHDLKHHEAIPVGRLRVSAESMSHMCAWATCTRTAWMSCARGITSERPGQNARADMPMQSMAASMLTDTDSARSVIEQGIVCAPAGLLILHIARRLRRQGCGQ